VDWSDALPILLAITAAIGLPLALRSRKKGGPQKVEELCQHLLVIGVKASQLEEGAGQEKAVHKRSWGHKSVGAIKLTGRNIDSINVIGVASQYGVRYFLDFLVRSVSLTGGEKKKKTRMVRKRSAAFSSKVVSIEWKGDDYLVRKLDLDYRLTDKLLQADLNVLKGGISIHPEPKYGYTRIRTSYFLPTPDLLEAMDIIAKHIKAG
jgi:hypothetical protein